MASFNVSGDPVNFVDVSGEFAITGSVLFAVFITSVVVGIGVGYGYGAQLLFDGSSIIGFMK